MRTIPSRRILFVISLILCCTVCAQEEKEFNVDSELYSYFQRCQENVGDSKVLHMADTLYWMSEKKGDQRMQAVALTLKLDHYYFKGDEEDSIIHYTKVVKEFAEKTNQPKYYYFVWNNRLILYYLKTGKSNIALYGFVLRPLVGARFQVLFHSSVRSAFHLSLTVLVHYRSLGSI